MVTKQEQRYSQTPMKASLKDSYIRCDLQFFTIISYANKKRHVAQIETNGPASTLHRGTKQCRDLWGVALIFDSNKRVVRNIFDTLLYIYVWTTRNINKVPHPRSTNSRWFKYNVLGEWWIQRPLFLQREVRRHMEEKKGTCCRFCFLCVFILLAVGIIGSCFGFWSHTTSRLTFFFACISTFSYRGIVAWGSDCSLLAPWSLGIKIAHI